MYLFRTILAIGLLDFSWIIAYYSYTIISWLDWHLKTIICIATSFTNLNMSTLGISILLHGSKPSADRLWKRGPGKCVDHCYAFYPLVLLCQQGRHFVRKKPSVGISAKKVRSMALLFADQLNVMGGKFTYPAPVVTHCCWVSKAQCIEGYQFLVKCQCKTY